MSNSTNTADRVLAWIESERSNYETPPDEIFAIFAQVVADSLFLRTGIKPMSAVLTAVADALERSPYDISPCSGCGEDVVCLPDGLPMCKACAEQGERES